MSGETAGERWSPVQRVESVLISILSLLDDAEVNSPANVDAGIMLRKEPEEYKQRVKQDVEASKRDIPADFVMPTHESTARKVEKPPNDEDFWYDSDEDEDTFGGSDSDQEMEAYDTDEDEADATSGEDQEEMDVDGEAEDEEEDPSHKDT